MPFSQSAASESRRSPRRVFNRAVGILREGRFELAQALLISEGGMAFITSQSMQMGARVVVSLVIPGGTGLVLRGFVVNDKDPVGKMRSYGIQFQELDLHQRRMIRSYVSAKTQAEAEAETDD